ncbi:DUF6879 family protein [Streptomyces sp. NPDC059479]|uniref:DUF6879 family protein n=1 Tax=Streptomyces sp. NPDC059479 TaxID=3346848 RepID=UPI00367D4E60
MSQRVPLFADFLGDCRHSAVHLEMRDVYTVADEDEGFTAWKSGHRYDLADRASWWTEFHGTVSDAVSRGVVVRRARVVSEPVTEYIRYEHSCTAQNLASGEDVRWLPRRSALDLMVPANDVWIFDGRLVRFGLFSGEGVFLTHVMDDTPHVAKQCLSAFEAVWERAVPHADFWV